jgi:hypothetical protein
MLPAATSMRAVTTGATPPLIQQTSKMARFQAQPTQDFPNEG